MKKVFLAVFILLLACTHPSADDSGATQEGIDRTVTGNSQFALDLYDVLDDKDGNLFFSPYSISTALSMTYEGARANTAEQMQDVFHFDTDADARHSSNAALYNSINAPRKEYKLSTANALFAEQDFTFLDEFMAAANDYYGARIQNSDFKGNADGERKRINRWVEDQTNNKIKDLIPAGLLNPLTRLVLVNAIYFNGDWEQEFDKKDTSKQDFRTPSGKTSVDMMSIRGESFRYVDIDNVQILEMPYKDDELSMVVMLPESDLSEIDEIRWDAWRKELKLQEVDVWFPRFKMETEFNLNDALAGMGMTDAFSSAADFSGMTGRKDLFISAVIHKAFVEVDEKGTEAAAATAVLMGELAAAPSMPKVFRADHPFIFMIVHRETGSILFMGRVVDPTA